MAQAVNSGISTEALVLLDDSSVQAAERLRLPADSLGTGTAVPAADYDARMRLRETLLDQLKSGALAVLAGADLESLTHYSVLPIMHLRIHSPAALARLVSHPLVRSIDEIKAVPPSLAQSLPLIRQPQAAAAGYTGTGTTAAVLDTGVDYTRAAFGSCSAPGGSCKVAVALDFAPNDGALDTGPMHGTNVAATVLGVAPGARIAALDVFRSDNLAYSNDLTAAVNWVVANKATYNIASINMSLGGGSYSGTIAPTDSFGVALQAAVNAGVVVVVASGNNGYTSAISWPAAYSNVVSVGAVYDSAFGGIAWSNCTDTTTAADKVTCFSNSASFLTLLAPGALITAANITMGGTSQATPHVAGAVAVLRAAFPGESVAQLIARLKTGPAVVDARNGISKPRLDLVNALGLNSLQTLTVSKTGAGSGTVTSSPAGIACGSTCSANFSSGAVVTLSAAPAAGSQFSGWSGACTGTGSCTVTMSAARAVVASFTPLPSYTLTVTKTGSGSGTVTSSPAGISCGASCSASFQSGTVVTLSAAPAAGSQFSGWSGACTGTGNCTVTVSAAATVSASFTPLPSYALTVSKTGAGSGTVTSSPAGISCGASCSAAYLSGTVVTLSAAPAAGSQFSGWSGACTGTGSCTVTVSAAATVSASFTPLPSYALTVSKTGAGSGTVTSSPAGISCGASCSAAYLSGTVVTLSAAPAAGSQFSGWSGACTGTGSCTVTMSAARAVVASFTPLPSYTLSITKSGSGTGTVSSSPAGLNCGGTCSAPFQSGTVVTLSATPAAGSQFVGWSGACTGSNPSCTLTVTAATTASANFAPLPSYTLAVSKLGNGSGTVDSSPAGINCGSSCSASYLSGTTVTLTATPATGAQFGGWGGACSGTAPSCTVAMSAARTVTATFTQAAAYTLTVSKSGTGSGLVTSTPAGITCGTDCSEAYPAGTVVTLTAARQAGSLFTGWTGACTGTVNTCTVTMSAARTVTAVFTLR